MVALFPSREIAITIGSFSVHWYGIMYLLGFVVAYFLLPILQKYRDLNLSRDQWSTILSWSVLGVIGGGRLGYVLFYEPLYFSQHPLEIFAVWNGGMSSHGGFIGVTLALGYVCWRMKLDIWRIADVVVVPIAIGLAFGRVGNFINQELYGTVTTLPWGIHIDGVEGLRHPTQIYAVFKDLFIALVCFMYLQRGGAYRPGRTAALFLMMYGVLRFLVEYVRAQDYPLIQFGSITLTHGQLLTIPIFLVGVFLWIALRDRSSEEDID